MGPRTLGEGFSHKMIVLLLNTPALVAQGRFRRRFRRFRNAVIAESRRGGGIKIASDAAGIERDNIIRALLKEQQVGGVLTAMVEAVAEAADIIIEAIVNDLVMCRPVEPDTESGVKGKIVV